MDSDRDEQTTERHRVDRRTLLKGAVAAGVAGAAYAAPVVSVVPAYGATSLVSFTVESGPVCIWFSPNQSNFGNWHLPNGDVNNYNPILGTNVGNGGWTCWPPAAQMPVVVNGITRYVNFVGIPDDWVGTQSGTCTDGGSTVTNYTMSTADVPWTGGGVEIFLDPSTRAGCEINVSGTVGGQTLGPSCAGSCNTPAPLSPSPAASWAVGSSTSPIGTNTVVMHTTTLTTALVKNTSYTSINVAALSFAVAVGDPISIGSLSGTYQTTFATAPAAINATTISVQSFTANNNYAAGTQVVDTTAITTALVKNTIYTSISVAGLTFAVAVGDSITIGSLTGNFQTVLASAPAAAGATTISVQSFTANNNYAVGQPVIDTGQAPNGNVGNGVFRSAYYHTGQPGRSGSPKCSFALFFEVRCRS